MAGLTVIPEMIANIAAAAKLSVVDLKEAAAEAKNFRAEIDSARDSTAGMTGSNPSGSTNTKQLAAALKAVR